MSNKNDKRILALREKIAEKKEEIKKVGRFNPITNCSLEILGVRFNLNVLDKEQAALLLIQLNAYQMSAEDLGFEDELTISGYPLNDWISDVESKLETLFVRDEERKLKVMEAKLEKLLSEEKKVELELDDIESFLKD